MAKTSTVYWARYSEACQFFDATPHALLPLLAESQKSHIGNNFVACPAIRNKHKNTFVTHVPWDISVSFFEGEMVTHDSYAFRREGLYDSSYAFDWAIRRIFFSAEPQLMETSPAYFQQTSYSGLGVLSSGSFDISKWFRPSSPNIQLWQGVNYFTARQDEPFLYFNFPNESRIVLKEFKMTDTLYDIATNNVALKNTTPKLSLEALYEYAAVQKQRKTILKEIQTNLL